VNRITIEASLRCAVHSVIDKGSDVLTCTCTVVLGAVEQLCLDALPAATNDSGMPMGIHSCFSAPNQ